MKGDALLVIMIVVFIYGAWVATGGPQRGFSKEGPFITPITSPGEEQQAYRITPPENPIDPAAYPRQVGGAAGISVPDSYSRSEGSGTSRSTSTSSGVDLYAH